MASTANPTTSSLVVRSPYETIMSRLGAPATPERLQTLPVVTGKQSEVMELRDALHATNIVNEYDSPFTHSLWRFITNMNSDAVVAVISDSTSKWPEYLEDSVVHPRLHSQDIWEAHSNNPTSELLLIVDMATYGHITMSLMAFMLDPKRFPAWTRTTVIRVMPNFPNILDARTCQAGTIPIRLIIPPEQLQTFIKATRHIDYRDNDAYLVLDYVTDDYTMRYNSRKYVFVCSVTDEFPTIRAMNLIIRPRKMFHRLKWSESELCVDEDD